MFSSIIIRLQTLNFIFNIVVFIGVSRRLSVCCRLILCECLLLSFSIVSLCYQTIIQ